MSDQSILYGQLYNLRDELAKVRNLNTEHPERVATMMQLLRKIRTSADSG